MSASFITVHMLRRTPDVRLRKFNQRDGSARVERNPRKLKTDFSPSAGKCKGNLARGLLRTLAKGGPKSNNISGYVDTTYLAKGGPKRTN